MINKDIIKILNLPDKTTFVYELLLLDNEDLTRILNISIKNMRDRVIASENKELTIIDLKVRKIEELGMDLISSRDVYLLKKLIYVINSLNTHNDLIKVIGL